MQATHHLEGITSFTEIIERNKINQKFNQSKTEVIIIGTKQMGRVHDLDREHVSNLQRKTVRTSIQF